MPKVPVTVKVNVPFVSEFFWILMVTMAVAELDPFNITEMGEREQVAVGGPPVQESDTVPVNPLIGVTVSV